MGRALNKLVDIWASAVCHRRPSADGAPNRAVKRRLDGFCIGPMRLGLLCFGLASLTGCAAVRDDFPPIIEAPTIGPADIDLAEYDLTFSEDFERRLDVSAWGCGTRWIAHTPWAGDFGNARFSDPLRNFPFVVANGLLRIEASKDGGRWRSGLLSGGNKCDDGSDFRQKFGYFEMRAKLPPGEGTWPAFWLVGHDAMPEYTVEIDVVEHYGHAPGLFFSHIHIHPGKDSGRKKEGDRKRFNVSPSSLYDYFNTYGVSVEEDYTIFYFNRREYWRIETRDEYKQRLFPLVNLALGSGYSIENTPNPSFMYVDYVRVYAKKQRLAQTLAARADSPARSSLSGADACPLALNGSLADPFAETRRERC